jgi:hypothetical protein
MAKRIWVDISLVGKNLSAIEALDLRNDLKGKIQALGIGEVVGAGCSMDGSGCDIEVEVADFVIAKRQLNELLSAAGLTERAKMKELGT